MSRRDRPPASGGSLKRRFRARFLAVGLLAGAIGLGASAAGKNAATGGDQPGSDASDRERYLDLYKRKQRAQRLNELWKLEGDLAAKRTAYAVLDLTQRKLYVKVRGRTFKAVSFTVLSATRRSRPVDFEELAFRAFTLQIKEGKGVEIETIQRKTLTEAEKREAGRSDEVDEPIGAAQGGAVETQALSEEDAAAAAQSAKVAGVAGGAIPPDPPPKYHMGFDGGLSLWVVADVPATPRAARFEPVLDLARTVGRLLGGSRQEAAETRLEARLPLALAQQIYRELLPGQRLLITR